MRNRLPLLSLKPRQYNQGCSYEYTDMKKTIALLLALLACTLAMGQQQFSNPVLWADVPDPDVIRVDSDFYMVTTTMHLMPGGPIMKSRDLVNWTTVGYLFDRLTDSPKYNMVGGTVYGRGQWATSLKYYNGRFYALFSPNDQPGGETYILTAERAEGPWHQVSRLPHFHDATLFFDDDGRAYVFYATGDMVELTTDLRSVKPNSHVRLFERDGEEDNLLEGSRVVEHEGRYYLLMISWPKGRVRREVCYRADYIRGPYEKRTVLDTSFGGFGGVGQGTIVDTPDGRWYGMIFQDRSGVGRVMTLVPCRWEQGWPLLGDSLGRVPEVMDKPVQGYTDGRIAGSDTFDGPTLGLDWQWNHNPVDTAWSLSERPGWLRLKTSRLSENLFVAPNTISQRLEGPGCEAAVRMDVSQMREGDVAGLSVFQSDAALLAIEKTVTGWELVGSRQSVKMEAKDHRVTGVQREDDMRVPLDSPLVWLRLQADFTLGQDLARLQYSTDGQTWHTAIDRFKMQFDYRRFFMGTRAAIFNFATRQVGGFVDVDTFEYSRNNGFETK